MTQKKRGSISKPHQTLASLEISQKLEASLAKAENEDLICESTSDDDIDYDQLTLYDRAVLWHKGVEKYKEMLSQMSIEELREMLPEARKEDIHFYRLTKAELKRKRIKERNKKYECS